MTGACHFDIISLGHPNVIKVSFKQCRTSDTMIDLFSDFHHQPPWSYQNQSVCCDFVYILNGFAV